MKTTSSILTLSVVLGLSPVAALAADPIDGLFNTGVDDAGVARAHGSRETHYRLIEPSPFLGRPYIFTSAGGFPVPPWLADSQLSAWIVPTAAVSANGPPVDYSYRMYLDLAGYDPASVAVNGQWATDNLGTDILVNGQGTGNPNSGQFPVWTQFALGGAFFAAGLNTVDFVLNNAPAGDNPTGLRVELSATGDRIGPGASASVVTGPTDVTIREGGDAGFTVSATGSYPVAYQWSRNGTPIQGATRAWLDLVDVRQSAAGTYSVVVSNGDGTDTASAVLTVTPTPVEVTRLPAVLVGGIVGRSYGIDTTVTLSQTPQWDLFTTITPLTESPAVVPIDLNGTQRFFRGREQ